MTLIEQFKKYLNWLVLSSNESLPWSADLIEQFKEYWDWTSIISNKRLSWSLDLIERFKEYWDWEYMSMSALIPWSAYLIERFKDKWHWEYLKYNQSIHACDKKRAMKKEIIVSLSDKESSFGKLSNNKLFDINLMSLMLEHY